MATLLYSNEFDVLGSGPPAGFDYMWEWINQESQEYVDQFNNNGHVEVALRDVEGELRPYLVLRAEHYDKSFISKNHNATGVFNYRSGGILTRVTDGYNNDYLAPDATQQRTGFTFGRYEIRAKVPGGTGTWPAIWLLGRVNNEFDPFPNGFKGWPYSGEIDIMEQLGREEAAGVYRTHHTVHRSNSENTWPHDLNPKALGMYHNSTTPYSDDFHVYRCDWTEDRIAWYVDDILVQTTELGTPHSEVTLPDGIHKGSVVDTSGTNWGLDTSGDMGWPWDHDYNNNFHLLINLAVGSESNWAGAPDPADFPAEFLIDYVRVYDISEGDLPVNVDEPSANMRGLENNITNNIQRNIHG